jgi:hypothetical protein
MLEKSSDQEDGVQSEEADPLEDRWRGCWSGCGYESDQSGGRQIRGRGCHGDGRIGRRHPHRGVGCSLARCLAAIGTQLLASCLGGSIHRAHRIGARRDDQCDDEAGRQGECRKGAKYSGPTCHECMVLLHLLRCKSPRGTGFPATPLGGALSRVCKGRYLGASIFTEAKRKDCKDFKDGKGPPPLSLEPLETLVSLQSLGGRGPTGNTR